MAVGRGEGVKWGGIESNRLQLPNPGSACWSPEQQVGLWSPVPPTLEGDVMVPKVKGTRAHKSHIGGRPKARHPALRTLRWDLSGAGSELSAAQRKGVQG